MNILTTIPTRVLPAKAGTQAAQGLHGHRLLDHPPELVLGLAERPDPGADDDRWKICEPVELFSTVVPAEAGTQ